MNDFEVLQYLANHDRIDLSHARLIVEMEKRKEILQKHPYRVWEGKNGKWYTYLDSDGKKKLTKRTTKKDIEDLIVSFWRELETGETIEDAFKEWNDWKLETGKIERSSHMKNKVVFNRHYKEFGKRKIRDVKPDEFLDFLESQVPKYNLTAKGFANLKTVTKGFLKRARRRKVISWNVEYMLTEIDISERDYRRVVKEDSEEVYNEEEARLLKTTLMQNMDDLNTGLLLLFVTGLRIGELAALKHIDIEEDCVHVRRTETVYREEDGNYVCTVKDFPKTEAGIRRVVVPESYQWLLKKIRLNNPFGEWAFEKKGKRIKSCNFTKRLRELNKELGISHKSPHKIRKTYVSMLMDNNVDTRMVIDQVGHSSILVTQKYYYRNRKTIEKKQEILREIGELQEICYLGKKGNGKNADFKPKTGVI